MNKKNGYDYDSGWFTPRSDILHISSRGTFRLSLIRKIKIYIKNLWRKWKEGEKRYECFTSFSRHSIYFGILAKEMGLTNAVYYKYLFYDKNNNWIYDSNIKRTADQKYYKKIFKLLPMDYYFFELGKFSGCMPADMQFYRFSFYDKDKKLIHDSFINKINH